MTEIVIKEEGILSLLREAIPCLFSAEGNLMYDTKSPTIRAVDKNGKRIQGDDLRIEVAIPVKEQRTDFDMGTPT